MQTQNVESNLVGVGFPPCQTVPQALAVDQLVTVEQFYKAVRGGICANHKALLSEDFLAGRCSAMRGAFVHGSTLAGKLSAALRSHYSKELQTLHRGGGSASMAHVQTDIALVAFFSRLHGIPGHIDRPQRLIDNIRGSVLASLPRLRRELPGASVHGIRTLVASLQVPSK